MEADDRTAESLFPVILRRRTLLAMMLAATAVNVLALAVDFHYNFWFALIFAPFNILAVGFMWWSYRWARGRVPF